MVGMTGLGKAVDRCQDTTEKKEMKESADWRARWGSPARALSGEGACRSKPGWFEAEGLAANWAYVPSYIAGQEMM
ncbi:MAG: hypothetical protein EBY83_01985 [Verrucomicrobia bacterium]|nr:hypothetical protein [Verrucomicrobiota bacterium]